MKFSLLVLTLYLCSTVQSLRILSVMPTVTKSHYAPTRRIIHELAKRGHEVVSISPYGGEGVTNVTWVRIAVTSLFEAVPQLTEELKVKYTFFNSQRRLWRTMNAYTTYITKLPELKSFIENDNSHFDLVIAEEFFQPVFYVFSHKYKAPLILLSTFGPGHFISEYMGNPLELSYVPNEFLDMFGRLNFFQRVKNLFCTIYDVLGRKFFSLYVQDQIARDVFKNLDNVPSLYDLERNVSLMLLNSHFSLNTVRPQLPNIIEIGGIHIEEVKPLSKDLQNILDSATNGAILFSFGSIMELALQPEDFVLKVLSALGSLKQKVLVKWNSDKKMPGNFKNIYPFKWLPQNDILAHPNTVLFITHGGLLSSQEAIYHGVPTICMPFYGDQYLNCRRSVHMGYGIYIVKDELTKEILSRSIERVTTDPSYRSNVKELSSRFRDRPVSAIDTALYWIEYCARHKGMDFAKGPGRNMHWYEYYYIDMIAFIWMTLQFIGVLKRFIVNAFKKDSKVKTN